LRSVSNEFDACSVEPGDVVCSDGLHPFLCGLCSQAGGFVIKGSEADHTVAYIRELWKPAIHAKGFGVPSGTTVTIDADIGVLYEGLVGEPVGRLPDPMRFRPQTPIYLFLGIPRMAQAGANLGADGVGLLRTNLIMQEVGKHPFAYIQSGQEQTLEDSLLKGITAIAEAFPKKPVWVRTMDFSTSDLRGFPGWPDEPSESNPMLGWRGLARELDQNELLRLEFRAIRRARENGCDNIGLIFPLVRTVGEYKRAKAILLDEGLRPHEDIRVGAMFETPSSALEVSAFIDAGLDFAFVGINDLTQYTLAADRANSLMTRVYDPTNDAVLHLVTHVLEVCREHHVWSTMSYQSPLLSLLGRFVRAGLDSISVFPDALNTVAGELVRQEELLH